MITEREAIERATAAVERIEVAADIKALFVDIVTKAIVEEFSIPDEWQVDEHKVGNWSVRNHITGEQYKTGARGGALRLVVFKYPDAAARKAYNLNKALKK